MRAQNLIKDFDYHYIFNTDEQRARAVKELNLKRSGTHVADIDSNEVGQAGVAIAREWGERNLTDLNEWYIWLDDNVSHLTRLPLPWYNYEKIDFDWDWCDPEGETIMKACGYDWHKVYVMKCSIDEMLKIWEELIEKCEQENTVFGGMSIEDNYFFRKKKWQYYTYVRTQNAVCKNTNLPFDYWSGGMIEDMARSVDVVARYGKVIVNKFAKPYKQFWEAGGIGSLEERMPNLISGCKILMKMFPGLLCFTRNKNYQLSFKHKTQKTVDRWRKENGYL
jgi:hypothetical protein